MEIEIISKECIQPSSPIPDHLKTHKLSFLDLHVPPFYFPLVLYYPWSQDTHLSPKDIDHIVSIRLQLLKQSLSQILSVFYPFAGKIKDSLSIDCNDEGIYFVEARTKSLLNEFLNNPDTVLITKFLPDSGQWNTEPRPGNYVVGVQVTKFACGGMVIAVCISHMIADGSAMSQFLKGWAATARKSTEQAILPKFDGSCLFRQNEAYPPREVADPSGLFTSYTNFGKFISRRFVFDASAIDKLKAQAVSSGVQNPTRVEVVTALLAKIIMPALRERYGSENPILLIHGVNLRLRARPQFSKDYMGNFLWLASALCNEKEAELHELISRLREAIAKLNADFVNSLQGDEGLLNYLEAVKYESETCKNAADKISFNSWCNFGLYDIDFGWGKPAWVSILGVNMIGNSFNGVGLMDTRGNGVEAWVILREEDMAKLQLDKEIVEFATVDPSPLRI